MRDTCFIAFYDELEKIAIELGGVWQKLDASTGADSRKQEQHVAYHFSPRAGSDRWEKFERHIRSHEFLEQLKSHAGADTKLREFADQMHALSRARTVGKIESSTKPGLMYEIRKLPDRHACTCLAWKFFGANPNYKCRHIQQFESTVST